MIRNFKQFTLKKFIINGLSELKIETPTKCQNAVIPKMLQNKNIICGSETGSGKTFAFSLPILNQTDFSKPNCQAIIFCPTRELANQIYKNIKYFNKFNSAINVCNWVGGEDQNLQIKNYQKKQNQIIIGTPNRIKSNIKNLNLNLSYIKTVVFDECDMIFDLNFVDDVMFLLDNLKLDFQIAIFSATITQRIKNFFKLYLKDNFEFDCSDKLQVVSNVTHYVVYNNFSGRNTNTLIKLLNSFQPYLCLIFVNSREDADDLYQHIIESIKSIVKLHGGLSIRIRKQIIKNIHKGKYQYVICTDLIARGLHFDSITQVISIGIPKNLIYYVHRSGRTGRQNETGESYLIVNDKDLNKLQVLKKSINFIEYNKKIIKSVSKRKNSYNRKTDIKENKIAEYKKNLIKSKYLKNKKVKPNYKKNLKKELNKINKEQYFKNLKWRKNGKK